MKLEYLFPCFFGIEKNCSVNTSVLLNYVYKNLSNDGIEVSNVGGFQSYNIDTSDNEIRELVTLIEENAKKLCFDLKVKNNIRISSMWFNLNKKGDYNNAHSHSGFMSGIFYLQTDDQSGAITFRHPSQLHPYFMKDVKVDEYHPAIANEWFFQPQDNDLFLFPSYLEHYVLPSKSDKDRISFAFNIDLV